MEELKKKKKNISKSNSVQKLASFVFVVPLERPSDIQLHKVWGSLLVLHSVL